MKRQIAMALLSVSLAGSPMLIGCDREVSKDETVKKNADGSTSKDETTVTQKPDGTIVKQHDESKNNP